MASKMLLKYQQDTATVAQLDISKVSTVFTMLDFENGHRED